MSEKTYHGSCHCGKVTFEADIDLGAGAGKCNCSICRKTRFFGVLLKPGAFRLMTGDAELTDYQFNTKSTHHLFCKHCGVRAFGKGYVEAIGGDFVSVNLSCLDDATEEEIANAPVRFANGRDNVWHEAPRETRHL